MKFKDNNSIILFGNKLDCRCNYILNITAFKRSVCIIKGTIYDSNKLPSKGAAIEVREINKSINYCKIIGYYFTDINGEYIFALEVKKSMNYEFLIYSPLK